MKNDATITPGDKGKIHICKKRVQNVKNDLGVPQITPPQTRKRVKKARKEYKMRKKKVFLRTRSTYYWNLTHT